MNRSIQLRLFLTLAVLGSFCPPTAWGQGVPIDGFLPMVGIALTNEYLDNLDTNAQYSAAPGGNKLGSGGVPFYDLALLDSGAGVTLLSQSGDQGFGIDEPYSGNSDGYRGTYTVGLGGAGQTSAIINDPLGLYAGGLQNRNPGSATLALPDSALRGQTNTSLTTLPAESSLPNILGLPFISRYATRIQASQPQVFEVNGKTVRTPAIDFLERGTGSQHGILRKAPMTLTPGEPFAQAPFWFYDFGNPNLLDKPYEDPSIPTAMQAGLFLNVNLGDDGQSLNNESFFYDTGASVTVLSVATALQLGIDVLVDQPEFTIAITGAGGVSSGIPGYYLDSFTIQAAGGSVTATNVPVIVYDIGDPGNIGNPVKGIVGSNLLSGRDLIIDPNPTLGGTASAGLYISDPVTTNFVWNSTAASAPWATGGNWSGAATPGYLSTTKVRHVSGGAQEAVVVGSQEAWDVVVSGGAAGQPMTLRIASGGKLTTFSGATIQTGGVVKLENATLDTQYLDVRGGLLTGVGVIRTGSGPIDGQVEAVSGTVAPGNGVGTLTIEGRFSMGSTAVLEMQLGGTTAGSGYDQLIVNGPVSLGGTLAVSLADLGGGPFSPTSGSLFELMTHGEAGGEFDVLDLPVSYYWDVHYNATSVALELLGATIAGDFNVDRVVDAADYAVWRDGFGTTYDQTHYAQWRAHYGQTFSPSDSSASAAPEPGATALLAAFGILTLIHRGPPARRGRAHNRESIRTLDVKS